MPKAKAKSAAKQKTNLCNKCGERHLPPTGKKCTRQKLVEKVESGNSDVSNDSFEESVGAASVTRGKGRTKNGEMNSYDSVLSRLVTSVDALQARVFGTHESLPQPNSVTAPVQFATTTYAPTAPVTHGPTLAQMRQDPSMCSQANGLVDKIEASSLGAYGLSRYLKRGFARAGVEDAPLVPTPWPQDFVIGYGEKQRLHYNDLDLFQWAQGFLTIIAREPKVEIKNLMLEHLRELFHDAQFHGWEAVKYAHSVILSSLEYGDLTWFDTLRMADIRRTVASGKASQIRNYPVNSSKEPQYFKNHKQGHQNSAGNGSKGNNRKTVKACNFYNEGKCTHAGDHEMASTKWRHVCRECWGRDHVENNCSFL
jgi:hypothetical protein